MSSHLGLEDIERESDETKDFLLEVYELDDRVAPGQRQLLSTDVVPGTF